MKPARDRHFLFQLLAALLLLPLALNGLRAYARPSLRAYARPSLRVPARPVKETYQPRIELYDFHDTLQPERAKSFAAAIERANRNGSAAVLVVLSTPGGMPESGEEMVAAMRASRVPVIVWVGHGMVRVSGEGLRLLAEADAALIDPTAYLTPLWSEVPRKLNATDRENGSQRLRDALVQSLARHGRNPAAVEQLSSGNHWFSGKEAVAAGFADAVVDKQADALAFLGEHGYRRNGMLQRLDVHEASLQQARPTLRQQLLNALMNPDLCVLILTLGLLLIYLEFNTPGTVVPGAAGVMLVMLAAYSLHQLPVTLTGTALCTLAALLLVLEAQFSRHGIFATLGVVALVLGLGHLVDGPLPQLEVGWGTAIGAGIGFGGVTASLLILGVEARRAKIRTGADAMLGWLAVAQTPLTPDGHILVRGELWRARLTSTESTVGAGEPVKVLRANGMVLEVTAVPISQTL